MTVEDIYLAGPMRGHRDFGFPRFHAATRALRDNGHTVFNPAERDEQAFGDVFRSETGDLDDIAHVGFDLHQAMRIDLDWIVNSASVVALLSGWRLSAGARLEARVGLALGLRVVELDATFDFDEATPVTSVDVQAAGRPQVGEMRVVDPATGGEKGSKLARFDLIPPHALTLLAEHYGRGSEKYEDHNWRRGYAWSLSFAALMRHAWAFWAGEDNDSETGTPHVVAVAWHALTLATFLDEQLGTDDRVNREGR